MDLSGGRGTVTSTLHYTDNTCTFDKTYRTAGNVSPLPADVVLGWQPTKRDLANLNLPGAWEFEALATARSGQAFEPTAGGLCSDHRGELVSDLMESAGVGKCSDPVGVRTADRRCLSVHAFAVRFDLQLTKRQTLGRLAFPLNRLWAGKSFVLAGQERKTYPDIVTDTEVRIAFTRVR